MLIFLASDIKNPFKRLESRISLGIAFGVARLIFLHVDHGHKNKTTPIAYEAIYFEVRLAKSLSLFLEASRQDFTSSCF